MDVSNKVHIPEYNFSFIAKTALKEAVLGPVPSLSYVFRGDKSDAYACQKEVVKLEKEIQTLTESKHRPSRYKQIMQKKYTSLANALKLERKSAGFYALAFAISLLLKPLFIFLMTVGFLIPGAVRMTESDKSADFLPLSVSVTLPRMVWLVVSCVGVVFGILTALFHLTSAIIKIKKCEAMLASLTAKGAPVVRS